MKRTKVLRSLCRKVYIKKKKEDAALIGRRINDYTQALHMQLSLPEVAAREGEVVRDQDVVKACLAELAALRKEVRFKNDFPNFPSFYKYIVNPKNGFTLEDVKEL